MPSSRESAPVRAGVYTRISWDPAGRGAGVERQRWTARPSAPTEVGRWPSTSRTTTPPAYSGKPRRAYERMLSAVARVVGRGDDGASRPEVPAMWWSMLMAT